MSILMFRKSLFSSTPYCLGLLTSSCSLTTATNVSLPLSLNKLGVSGSLQRPKDGGFKTSKRLGRGGQGKTAGRGRKGWKAKHSQARPHKGFEGGQSGLVKKIPKLGVQRKEVLLAASQGHLRPLCLDKLQIWIDSGRLPKEKTITMQDLCMSGICGRVRDGIVLIAKGKSSLTTPVHIQVTKSTPLAHHAVTSIGGTVESIYTDKAYIHHITAPHKYTHAFSGTYLGLKQRQVFSRYPDMIEKSGDSVLKKILVGMQRK